MKPGDILVWKDQKFGIDRRWRVVGVFHGALGQESLIEMENITERPGWTGEWEWHPRVFVPEVLTRDLTVEPPIADEIELPKP